MKLYDTVGSILKQKGRDLCWIAPGASVYEAIELMADRHIGALLVFEGPRLVGIISERDYARKVILKGRLSKETRVREIMTTDVISVGPKDNVDDCMTLMTENRIRHLPVIDEGQVVGVVSIGDLVKWIISAQHETIEHLENYIAGRYPG